MSKAVDSPLLIAGAGALGSVFGAMLRAAGHRVAMLGRTAHLDAIAREGLHVSGIFGERRSSGFALHDNVASLAGRYKLILFAVKSYDTEALAARLLDYLEPDGLLISLQNGVGNLEKLASVFGPRRVLGARVIFGAEITRPGAVRVTVAADKVVIGPPAAACGSVREALYGRAQALAQTFSSCGIDSAAVEDIVPALWMKLFYNVALNPLGALLKVHYGALGDHAEIRPIMNQAIEEAFAVARHLDITLPVESAADYIAQFYQRLLPATYNHRPSMLYDLEHRGRTEIDALNGKVMVLARENGLAAPVNTLLTSLIKGAESMRKI